MHLTRLFGENFRLFERFELAPNPNLNLILGANASGKTSLLEAIYSLGRGSSFRGTPAEACGRAGPQWLVHGRVSSGEAPESAKTPLTHPLPASQGEESLSGLRPQHYSVNMGVAWTPDGLRMRIDQVDATTLELVRRFPVQILEPDSHRLLEDGPAYRRRYLDWGVFHVEHRFYPVWRRYQRALGQRNHSLKASQSRSEIEAWNAELASAGEAVQEFRAAQLELLRGRLGDEIRRLLGPAEWTLELARGWPAEKPLAQTLADHFEHDRRQGKTGSGPHRAELKLKLAGRGAKHQVSRGQQKLLIAALLLSQARLIAQHGGVTPALLVDDFPAELGEPFQQALLAALRDYPGQVFVTSIERTEALKSVPKNAVFHVEHGSVGASKQV